MNLLFNPLCIVFLYFLLRVSDGGGMMVPYNHIINILKANNIVITGVLHVGAHECEEMEFYNYIGIPAEQIIWIEAISTKVLQAQSKGIPNVYYAVITDQDDEDVAFNLANNDQSSSVLEFGTHSIEHPDVVYVGKIHTKSITVNTFFERNNIDASKYDFWNFDIQGAELMALKGAVKYLPHVKVIYLEVNVNELYKDCALLDEIDLFLSQYNFVRVTSRITQFGWGDALYINSNFILSPVNSDNERLAVITDRGINVSQYNNDLMVFVIHYKKLQERKIHILEQFSKHNLKKYKFVEDIDRDNLDNEKIDIFHDTYDKAQIAIALSHFTVYKSVMEKYDYAVIFEDDIILCDNFSALLSEYLSQLPEDYDILFIGDCCNLHIPQEMLVQNTNVYFKNHEKSDWGGDGASRCTDSYIISNKGATLLYTYLRKLKFKINIPVDWFLNIAIRELDLRVYWAEPTIVTQGSQRGLFLSSYLSVDTGSKLPDNLITLSAPNENNRINNIIGKMEKLISENYNLDLGEKTTIIPHSNLIRKKELTESISETDSNIKIIQNSKNPEFIGIQYLLSDNWISYVNIDDYKDQAINYLEIGVLYGANIISVAKTYGLHNDSKLYCIDPWEDYDDYTEYKNSLSSVYDSFISNIGNSGLKHKIIVNRGYSNVEIQKFQDNFFDIIYIDGNHEPEYVLEDAVLSLRKLKYNGIMIFNDYGWGGPDVTQRGIDAFLAGYRNKIYVLGQQESQVFIKKKKAISNPYFTHQPFLIEILKNTTGNILELGCGEGSTLVIREIIKNTTRKLVSLESDFSWFRKYAHLADESHQLYHVNASNEDTIETGNIWVDFIKSMRLNDFEVVFIDSWPYASRKLCFDYFLNKVKIIVFHDFEFFPVNNIIGNVVNTEINKEKVKITCNLDNVVKNYKLFYPPFHYFGNNVGPSTLVCSNTMDSNDFKTFVGNVERNASTYYYE